MLAEWRRDLFGQDVVDHVNFKDYLSYGGRPK
jgi:hypothetical protein